MLEENPGMRRSDLMNDEEITTYLKNQQERITRFGEMIADDPSAENSAIGNFLRSMRENQKLTREIPGTHRQVTK